MSLADDAATLEAATQIQHDAGIIRAAGMGFEMDRLDGGMTIDARDAILAATVAELLMKHYPGHPWAVTADHRNGVIVIKNMGFSFLYGYVLKIAEDDGPRLHVEVMRAGGELLERYRVARKKAQEEDYRDKIPQLIKPEL
jgi:negative regulator of sigma E activity